MLDKGSFFMPVRGHYFPQSKKTNEVLELFKNRKCQSKGNSFKMTVIKLIVNMHSWQATQDILQQRIH